jgi:hypothetical protein
VSHRCPMGEHFITREIPRPSLSFLQPWTPGPSGILLSSSLPWVWASGGSVSCRAVRIPWRSPPCLHGDWTGSGLDGRRARDDEGAGAASAPRPGNRGQGRPGLRFARATFRRGAGDPARGNGPAPPPRSPRAFLERPPAARCERGPAGPPRRRPAGGSTRGHVAGRGAARARPHCGPRQPAERTHRGQRKP